MDRDDASGLDQLASRVLRVHPEPHASISDAAVHAHLTDDPSGYVSFLQARLEEIATGASNVELTSKVIFSDGPGGGDFRVMPCVFRGAGMVVKTVKIVGTNLTQKVVPDQVTVGKAFCLEPDDNFITHIFDACLLSSARTGACAAVVVSLLAERRRTLGIVGAGRVGYYAARYIASLGGVEQITLYDLLEERAQTTAELLRRELGDHAECRAGSGVLPASCDALVLATTSTQPHWTRRQLESPLVVSVGADTEDQRELDSSCATAEIYTDSGDSVRVGDLRAWIADGAIVPADVTDLLTLLREGPRMPSRGPRIFISTGSALFDNLTIAYLLHRHRAGSGA
jgi:ornithine cyclodeaminase/alanine dehydrogenase-like protein (mu-crystallin family)